jgi:hypothetical protein
MIKLESDVNNKDYEGDEYFEIEIFKKLKLNCQFVKIYNKYY